MAELKIIQMLVWLVGDTENLQLWELNPRGQKWYLQKTSSEARMNIRRPE